MDMGDGHLRYGSVEDGNFKKEARLDGIDVGIEGSSSVDEIGDLGSVKRDVEIENLEKSVDSGEMEIGVNGCSAVNEIGDLRSFDRDVKIVTSENLADCGVEIGINGSVGCGNIKISDKASGFDEIKIGNDGSYVDVTGEVVSSLEMNGDEIEGEKVVNLMSKGIVSSLEKGLDNMGKTTPFNEIKQEINGSSIDEIEGSVSGGHQRIETPAKTNGAGVEIEKKVETPLKVNVSEEGGSGGTPTTKGYGLKKWRRIRRDHGKDGSVASDPSRILKRGLSNAAEPAKARDLSADNTQKSEGSGSVASTNSVLKNLVFSAPPISVADLESRLAVGIAFPIGTDSENSEDQSSKSTAASASKLRMDVPMGIGSTKEKGKVKILSGRGSGGTTHRAHQGKGKVDTSKKLRGEKTRAEKENSHSSVESDLRSSPVVFMQAGVFSGVNDGRQRERSLNYSGENSDEVQLSEPQSSEEVQANYYKENGEEVEVISREGIAVDMLGKEKKEESENHRPQMDQDPLIESIVFLQTVQEALEKELKEFVEIGKGPVSKLDGSSHAVGSPHHVQLEETEESTSAPLLESQLVELAQKVNLLECKLEVKSAALLEKESMVLKLESILNKTQLSENKTGGSVLQDIENELEGLFQKRIEAEVEYLTMVRATQKLKVVTEDRVSLLEEQKSLAEDKVTTLKKQVEELDNSCKTLLGTEEVLKVQNNVCKYSLCLFMQLVLLCIVFGSFILQLFPHTDGFVPT